MANTKLWEREPYIDLFRGRSLSSSFEATVERAKTMTCPKNDYMSANHIQRGNECFQLGNHYDAMWHYTCSLRYAEPNSNNMFIARAKTSACFFRAKWYEEALKEIGRASCRNTKLPPLLEQRRSLCNALKHTSTGYNDRETSLSYPENDLFHGLARGVNVTYSEQYGVHLTAATDIPQNQVILADKVFAVNHMKESDNMCYTCYRKFKSFIPCESCSRVLYCDHECQLANLTHKYECGTFFGMIRNYEDEPEKIQLLMQSILTAISIFDGKLVDMMSFVNKTVHEKPDAIPTELNALIEKYRLFYKLKGSKELNTLIRAHQGYSLLMKLPKIEEIFNDETKKMFLTNLCGQHMSIIHANAFESLSVIGVGFLDLFFYQHKEPNAICKLLRNKMIVETSRNVQNGDQIFVSYANITQRTHIGQTKDNIPSPSESDSETLI